MNKNKLFKALGGIAIDLLIVAAISFTAVRIANAYSYSLYFVDGMSMYPTLEGDTTVGGGCFFGLEDNSSQAINHIERFDIISTYFSFESKDFEQPYVRNSEKLNTATLKIKRVYGLPGDTISVNGDYFSISCKDRNGRPKVYEFTSENCPFPREGDKNHGDNIYGHVMDAFTLGEDEYFVMGDNWTRGLSQDCITTGIADTPHACIYKENIFGVAINIQGACTVEPYHICPDCGRRNSLDTYQCVYCRNWNLHYEAELKDRQYFKKEISLKNVWQKYIGSLGI